MKFEITNDCTIKVDGHEHSRKEIGLLYGREVLTALCIASSQEQTEIDIEVDNSQEAINAMIGRYKKSVKKHGKKK